MAIEDALPLQFAKPGFFANGTTYQAKGRWHEGNLVRFHENTIRPIGGWAPRGKTGAAMVGTPIEAICWQLEDGTPFVAVGTTVGLYIIDANNVVYNITPASPSNIPAPPYNWQLHVFGAYLMAVNSLRGDETLTLVNTYVWQGATGSPATPAWTTAVGPRGAYSGFATPERFWVVLRGKDSTDREAAFGVRSGVDLPYSERRVYWADQETLINFVSSDIDTGGDFDLQTNGRLIVGAPGRGQSFLWTDVDLWTMTFIGGELIFSFTSVGQGCGIVSKRAFAIIDKGAFWMGRGKFFVYDGFVRNIPCEVTDAVFNDFNDSAAHTVWAFSNARYNEITWFYPSAGSIIADRYVTYNHAEDHWVFGTLQRSAGVPQRFTNDVIDEPKPAFFDADANMFAHETGNERDSQAWLASGPVELGNGDRLMRIQGIMPDEAVSGDVQLRLYGAMAADSLETVYGPYTLGPVTNLRLSARQVRVRLEEATASDWRVGITRLLVRPVERRGIGPGAEDLVPASLEIIPPDVTLINAQHYTFQSIVRNAAGQVLDIEPDTWTSDNTAQIPVDPTGTVTALASPSSANIQAFITSPALASNIATVTVTADNVPASIELVPTALNVTPTGTGGVTAIVRNAGGQILTGAIIDSWSTDTPAKATIAGSGNLTGTVTGVATGTANVAAHITSPALVSNNCLVTVTDPFITHTFVKTTTPLNFVVTTGGTINRTLLVAGGGGGGGVAGSGVGAGGGGAGGAKEVANIVVANSTTYPIVIGNGGAGGNATGIVIEVPGHDGTNTTFAGNTAHGGGGGAVNSPSPDFSIGRAGGSGGGGSASISGGSNSAGGAGTGGEGHNGGAGVVDNHSNGGGGGGGGAVGHDSPDGAGGAGLVSDISGVNVTYATGGNGAIATGSGGVVGAVDNFGDGGQGAADLVASIGGNGGAGTVIIRYKVSTGIVATGGVKVTHS